MKVNPWALGIIFLGAFIYFAWNNFEMPLIFGGETTEIDGKIINIKTVPGLMGQGFVQKATFIYRVGKISYIDNTTVDNRNEIQRVGNKVRLVFRKNRPKKNKVIGFYANKSFYIYEKEKGGKNRFYSKKESGYYQVDLINGLSIYTEYGYNGKIIQKIYGDLYKRNDTLIFKNFIIDTLASIDIEMKFLESKDSTYNKTLTNLKTGIILK